MAIDASSKLGCSCDFWIFPDGDQRVFETGHDDDLIDEAVVGAAHAMEPGAQYALLARADGIDDQDLEIGPGRRRALGGCRLVGLVLNLVVLVEQRAIALALTAAIGFADQGPVEPGDGLG